MASLIQIIQYLRPETTFRGFADIYESIQSADGSPLPTLEEIDIARPAAESAIAAALAAPVVPIEVTMSQFRRALRAAGIDPNAIANSLVNDPDALDQWEYSATVRRAHPLVNAMAQQLGKTSGEIDAIFIHAATL